MSQYFRKVRDPQRLLARERAPITGRRVPKIRSKRSQASNTTGFAGISPPSTVVVAIVVVATLAVAGVVAAVVSRAGDNPGSAPAASTSPSESANTSAPVSASTEGAPASTEPAASTTGTPTTLDVTTTIVTPSTVPIVATAVRLTSVAAATAASITPSDPGAQASFEGPLPSFNFALDCADVGCSFSLRAFSPGSVSAEGLTSVPATAGRFVVTTARSSTCTGSNGTQFSRQISNVIDLTLSGSQVVDGVEVPQQIAGTLTTVTPEAGYVPHVGDVVDEGAEVGCAGQTLVFTVAGALTPG